MHIHKQRPIQNEKKKTRLALSEGFLGRTLEQVPKGRKVLG